MLITSCRIFKTISRVAIPLLLALTATVGFANNAKISPDLQSAMNGTSGTLNVIIQYNQSQQNPGLLGGLLGTVGNLLNVVLNTVFSLIPAATATLHPTDIENLSNMRSRDDGRAALT